MAFIDECKLYRLPGIVAPVARRVRQMVKERSQGGDGGYWSSGLRFVLGGPGSSVTHFNLVATANVFEMRRRITD
jgi:hypothetical protein